MTRRPGPYVPRSWGTLKAAVSEAVTVAGGMPAAAERLGRSGSTVHGWTDPARPDVSVPGNFIGPLDDAAAAHGGGRPILEHLAADANHLLLPLPLAGTEDMVAGDAARLAEKVALVFGDVAAFLAPTNPTPGRIDAREAAVLLGEVDQVLGAAGVLRQRLDGIRREGEGR